MARLIDRSVVRFALAGLANTAVGYGVILALHYGLGAGAFLANAGGYLIGGLLSYGLNHRYTFESSRPHAQALPRFVAAASGCFALNLMVLEMSIAWLAWPVPIAQALAVATYAVTFYAVSRWLVFAPAADVCKAEP